MTERTAHVIDILLRIHDLLLRQKQALWAARVSDVLKDVRAEGDSPSTMVYKRIRRDFLGGMGSLDDEVGFEFDDQDTPHGAQFSELMDKLHEAIKPD